MSQPRPEILLISIVPVVLSLLGSVGCFVIGAVEVFNAFLVIMLSLIHI